ncbi:MAG: hypothetical protein HUJ76_08370 [Parasporobacterium sp.]|nr:hypothetical protein [Parasporobacterium sp.]
MADQKSAYSEASKHYVEVKVPESAVEKGRFDRSKMREEKYNENWSKQKVNINDIVDAFAPDFTVKEKGTKYIFKGGRYDVSADMAGGYLRIYDNKLKTWVKLDGSPVSNSGEGHYKIKKREEM